MLTDEKGREEREAPRGPIRFHLQHMPTGTLLGTYRSWREAERVRERYQASDREGAAQGHYRISWSFAALPPEGGAAPVRARAARRHVRPDLLGVGIPVDPAPHTNPRRPGGSWRTSRSSSS